MTHAWPRWESSQPQIKPAAATTFLVGRITFVRQATEGKLTDEVFDIGRELRIDDHVSLLKQDFRATGKQGHVLVANQTLGLH